MLNSCCFVYVNPFVLAWNNINKKFAHSLTFPKKRADLEDLMLLGDECQVSVLST
jgi:hypothetical protein